MQVLIQNRVIDQEQIRPEVVIRDDNCDLIHMDAPEDSARAWNYGFQMIVGDEKKGAGLETLIRELPDLISCYSKTQDQDKVTFLNLLAGLFNFLNSKGKELIVRYPQSHNALLQFLYQFEVKREFPKFTIRIRYKQQLLFIPKDYPTEDFELSEISKDIFANIIASSYQAIVSDSLVKKQSGNEKKTSDQTETVVPTFDGIKTFIENFPYFCNSVSQSTTFVVKSFSNFLKALIDFIKQEGRNYLQYSNQILDMCEFIVKNEYEELDDQRTYLNYILTTKVEGKQKRSRLQAIITDIKSDEAKKPTHNSQRLSTVISLISEYYLDNYNLDEAAEYWNQVEKKDWLLGGLISLIKNPLPAIVRTFLVFILLSVLAFFYCENFTWVEPYKVYVPYIALSILVIFYISTISAILWVVITLVRTKTLFYSQLLLPRILGAIIVGLTALIVQDTPWLLGITSNLVNMLVLSTLTYGLSFVYIFIEVYKSIKANSSTNYRKITHHKDGVTFLSALDISKRIYLIGLFESLTVILFSSTLVYPSVGISLEKDAIGGIVFSSQVISYGFFPALILFWTGLALFIGSFVQLLWQDRHITTPL